MLGVRYTRRRGKRQAETGEAAPVWEIKELEQNSAGAN
jgi:hypothetical protein